MLPRGRRGQAEVIGGLVVITALVLSLGIAFTALVRLSTTSTTGIARRGAFESERLSEALTALYDIGSRSCYVVNSGPVPVTVVRVWVREGEGLAVYGASTVIRPGEILYAVEAPEGQGSWPVDFVELAVTARGNVFPLRASCELERQRAQLPGGTGAGVPPPPPFTSEQVLNSARVVRGATQGYAYALVGTVRYPLIYNYSGTWYCSFNSTSKGVITRVLSGLRSDVDRNRINEIVIAVRSDTKAAAPCSQFNVTSAAEWDPGKFSGTVSFVFERLIYVESRSVDTIALYFKVIVTGTGGGVAQQLTVMPIVTLYSETSSLSTTASATTVGARQDVAVIFGTATFPVRAFNFNLTTGVYSLRLELQISAAPSIDLNGVRLEYLAVVGAELADPWR